MRIGFDVRSFLRDETGIGVYYRNLLFALAEIDSDHHYCLFSASRRDRFDPGRLPPFRHMTFRDLAWPSRLMDFAWYRLAWPPLDTFLRCRLDLTHSPTPLILPSRGRNIVTAHDLFFLEHPGQTDRHTRRYFVRRAARSLRRADGVIAVSHHVHARLLDLVEGLDPSRVRVIHHGTDPDFARSVPPERLTEIRKRYRLPEKFILFVGASEPRKNLPRLIRALPRMRRQFRAVVLVIVGRRGSDHANVMETVTREGVESRVRWLDYCPSADLRGLYDLAEMLVFPSLCEGFGLPLLEAMAAGLPAAVANAAALPEIAGESALTFDPLDPEDMARRIEEVLESDALRRRLREAGRKRSETFDWKKTAAETLSFYRDVTGAGST